MTHSIEFRCVPGPLPEEERPVPTQAHEGGPQEHGPAGQGNRSLYSTNFTAYINNEFSKYYKELFLLQKSPPPQKIRIPCTRLLLMLDTSY